MGFSAAISSCFRNYATFSGRASRSEFWWFILFFCLILTPAILLGPFGAIVILPILLPAISVEVRRLHDIDRSGWWVWLSLLPPINLVVKLIWLTRKGTAGVNRFGVDPLSDTPTILASAVSAPVPAAMTSMSERADQLAKIKALLDAGTINQDEFERMKAEVLAS